MQGSNTSVVGKHQGGSGDMTPGIAWELVWVVFELSLVTLIVMVQLWDTDVYRGTLQRDTHA